MSSKNNQNKLESRDGRDGFQVIITIKAKDIVDSYRVWTDNSKKLSQLLSLIVCLQ